MGSKCPKCDGRMIGYGSVVAIPGGQVTLISCQSCGAVVGAIPDPSELRDLKQKVDQLWMNMRR